MPSIEGAKMPVTRAELRAECDRWKHMHSVASEKLRISEIEIAELRPVVEAAVAWNDVMPALTPPEAKLVAAVVNFLNMSEKRERA